MIQMIPFVPHAIRASLMLAVLLSMTLLQACSSFGPLWRHEALPLPKQRVDFVERHVFPLGGTDDVVGQLATVPVERGDTLSDLARHYGVGFRQIADANPEIDPWLPQDGDRALLPLQFVLPDAPRKGVVINLATMRLFHFPSSRTDAVYTYPVGIGREGRASPQGFMIVDRKTPNPTWYVPESIRRDHAKKGDPLPAIVSPGPDNPLGDYAIYLSRPSYLIHGTNKPFSIGVRASNGCIRLYPEDIRVLYHDVKDKSQVRIVNQPYLIGTAGSQVYLEAHPPHEEVNAKQAKIAVRSRLKSVEKKLGTMLDWAKVDQVINETRGIPIPVNEHSPSFTSIKSQALALDRPSHLNGQPEPLLADESGWHVRVAVTKSQTEAEKMAAMLNHMGPRIPARAVEKHGRYEVMAGPYGDARSAKRAAKQLRVEAEITAKVVVPSRSPRLSVSRVP